MLENISRNPHLIHQISNLIWKSVFLRPVSDRLSTIVEKKEAMVFPNSPLFNNTRLGLNNYMPPEENKGR